MRIQDGVDRIDNQKFEKIENSLKLILVTQFEVQALEAKLAQLKGVLRDSIDFVADTLDGDYFEDQLTFCITPNGKDHYGVTLCGGKLSDFYPIVRPEVPKPEFEYKPYDLPEETETESSISSVDGFYSLGK
jgi:hypothetical protein